MAVFPILQGHPSQRHCLSSALIWAVVSGADTTPALERAGNQCARPVKPRIWILASSPEVAGMGYSWAWKAGLLRCGLSSQLPKANSRTGESGRWGATSPLRVAEVVRIPPALVTWTVSLISSSSHSQNWLDPLTDSGSNWLSHISLCSKQTQRPLRHSPNTQNCSGLGAFALLLLYLESLSSMYSCGSITHFIHWERLSLPTLPLTGSSTSYSPLLCFIFLHRTCYLRLHSCTA